MRTVYLWLREDGRAPKAIGEGVDPPGPGKIVAVKQARSADEARLLYQLACQYETATAKASLDELAMRDPGEFGRLVSASLRVKEVPRG